MPRHAHSFRRRLGPFLLRVGRFSGLFVRILRWLFSLNHDAHWRALGIDRGVDIVGWRHDILKLTLHVNIIQLHRNSIGRKTSYITHSGCRRFFLRVKSGLSHFQERCYHHSSYLEHQRYSLKFHSTLLARANGSPSCRCPRAQTASSPVSVPRQPLDRLEVYRESEPADPWSPIKGIQPFSSVQCPS